ncbi:hypothetical protein HYZ80_00665 [Candidatus Parcubacteria bacterium]|nr:hypothetical protein [Candidatus Parcubacteria bacterium]
MVQHALPKSVALIVLLLAGGAVLFLVENLSATGLSARTGQLSSGSLAPASAASVALSRATLLHCLRAAADRDACLGEVFHAFLKQHSTVEALAILKSHIDTDGGLRLACHPIAHAIGRETFRIQGTVQAAFAACNQTCHSGCYHGATERFLRGVAAAEPERRDVSPTDLHYPCSKLRAKYRPDCYVMQTSRMSELGLDTAYLFMECRKAGEYAQACMQSIGRDLSNDARIKDPKFVAQRCAIGTGEEQRACIRGVVYALADNTWDGRYAFPFCEAVSAAADRAHCFSVAASYLQGTFAKSVRELQADCQTYTPASMFCREALAD